jgi:nucleoside-diphosphate-sugar epimerase
VSTAKTALITGITGQDARGPEEVTIFDVAQLDAEVVGFASRVGRDASKPEEALGTLLDSARFHTAWEPRIPLHVGIVQVYAHYRQQVQA